MLSPLVSWLLSSSSSSSSSEESHDINTDESDYENDNVDVNEDQNDNMEDDEKDHLLTSCNVDDDDTIPVALAVPDASPSVTIAFPATKDDKDKDTVTATTTTTAVVTRSKRQRNTTYSIGTRQRLWTKQNEIELLKGYLDYIKQQGKTTTTSLQNDVASFYDQVIPKLNAYFNKNQLVEKLRRLKRKHKMILDKGKDVQVPFKNSEEQVIFELSNKIWGSDIDHDVLDVDDSRPVPESPDLIDNVKVKIEQVEDKRMSKRLRLTTDDVNTTNEQKNGDDVTSIQGFIEETMRSCFSPLLKELLADEPLGALPVLLPTGEVEDEQLIKRRRVLELEVYLNRLELLQGQIKDRLEGLRSSLV